MKITAVKSAFEAGASKMLVATLTTADLEKKARTKKTGDGVSLPALQKLYPGDLEEALKSAKFKGATGQTFTFNSGQSLVLVLGWDESKLSRFESLAQYRKMGSVAAALARSRGYGDIFVSSQHADFKDQGNLRALIEGAMLSGYSFTQYKSKKDDAPFEISSISIHSTRALSMAVVEKTLLACAATARARDLVNTPPRDCTPSYIADQCRKVAKGQKLKIDIFDEAALKKLGAGALLAVAQGSEEPPFLIRMVYRPKRKSKKILGLVGKGVTFDSGGLSIKTGAGMETMKCDMSGAAAVLSVMSIISDLQPDFEVRAYIPTTENMINGRATRPGDVVTAMSGKTIEILNTDAEGRLILADAITLAERDECDTIVDLATLTGACMVALGTEYAGLFANDEKLSAALIAAGEEAGEHFWPLPLAKEYKDWIKSPVADIKNLGRPFGGAITGALFLEEFIVKARWAHLDIAGPAFTDSDNGHIRKGGVGFGVRTLVNYLDEGF